MDGVQGRVVATSRNGRGGGCVGRVHAYVITDGLSPVDLAQCSPSTTTTQIVSGALNLAKSLRDTAQRCDEFAHLLTATPITKLAEHPEAWARPIQDDYAAIVNSTAGLAALHVPQILSPTTEDDGKKRKRKRGDKEKKIKDPHAPKRPQSAYLLYQNEVRKAMQEKFKDLPYKEVLGEIAKSWSALSAAEKKVRSC